MDWAGTARSLSVLCRYIKCQSCYILAANLTVRNRALGTEKQLEEKLAGSTKEVKETLKASMERIEALVGLDKRMTTQEQRVYELNRGALELVPLAACTDFAFTPLQMWAR